MPLALRALLSVVLRAWQARLSEVVTQTFEVCGHGWLIMVLMYIHKFSNVLLFKVMTYARSGFSFRHSPLFRMIRCSNRKLLKFKLGCLGWSECSSVLSAVERAGGPSNVAQTSCCMGFVSAGTPVLLLTRQPNSTHVHHRCST